MNEKKKSFFSSLRGIITLIISAIVALSALIGSLNAIGVFDGEVADKEEVAITIKLGGQGGTTNPNPGLYIYSKGTQISITAMPEAGFEFEGWTGGFSDKSPVLTINADKDLTISAHFKPSSEPPPTPPVITFFNASPVSIDTGKSCTLSWEVTDATKVTIDPGIGDVSSTGNILVSPTVTTTYTLTARNEAESTSKIAKVTVLTPTPPPTPLFADAEGLGMFYNFNVGQKVTFNFYATVDVAGNIDGTFDCVNEEDNIVIHGSLESAPYGGLDPEAGMGWMLGPCTLNDESGYTLDLSFWDSGEPLASNADWIAVQVLDGGTLIYKWYNEIDTGNIIIREL